MTITMGTPVELNTGVTGDITCIVALSNTKGFAIIPDYDNSLFKGVAFTVSGLVVSPGSPVTMDADETNATALRQGLAPNGASEAVFANRIDIGANADGQLILNTISGTTVTPDTPTVLNSTVSTSVLSIAQLTTDKYICLFGRQDTNETEVFVVTQSGSTLTDESRTTLLSSFTNAQQDIVALSSTRAIAVYNSSGTIMRCDLLNISGTTVTSIDTFDLETNSNASVSRKNILARVSSTKAVVAYRVSTSYKLRILQDDTSSLSAGTTYTYGSGPLHVAAGSVDNEFIASSTSVTSYSVSGTTITSNSDTVAIPSSSRANIAHLGSNVWIGTSLNGTEVEAFAFSKTNFTYQHSSNGIPGSLIV